MAKQTGLSGWGRTFVPGREVRSENLPAVTRNAVLTRGLGRSYGDASLPPPHKLELAGSTLADRILGFDADTGVLRAEAGLVLSDMNRLFLPRGFFTPVTPGTRFVTLGGMVASDVHGKNHHVDGTIGRHVQRLLIQTANGRSVECSREHEPELFLATLGGMGLTGHILEVQLKLQKVPSPWIHRESYRIDNLDQLLVKLKESGKEWPFTVAWIDTVASGKNLGRGILYVGRWAEPNEAPSHAPKPQQQLLTMPFPLPSGLLNRFTIGLFNQLIYTAHTKPHKQDICDPDSFFYPLDKVRHWNLAYGAAGVTQHQAVIPEEAGAAGVRRLIELLAETGSSSFLSVIKDCGPEGEGLISFPRPGMSLALDIPITPRTQEVIDRLNEHVRDCGGRIYLTKDGFTRRDHFRAMEPRLARFLEVKAKWDPEFRIHSALSDRLFGGPHAAEHDEDEEQVEHASRAFARAQVEREERALASTVSGRRAHSEQGAAAEQLAQAAASTAAIGQRPPLEVSAAAAGIEPVAPGGPAEAAAESEASAAIKSAPPPVVVGTPPPEPERAPVESTAPVFQGEPTLIGPGLGSSVPPADRRDDESLELEPVEPAKNSAPPPVPAAATRPPPPPSASLPPPSGRVSVPPPPARTSSAPRASVAPPPSAPAPSRAPGASATPPASASTAAPASVASLTGTSPEWAGSAAPASGAPPARSAAPASVAPLTSTSPEWAAASAAPPASTPPAPAAPPASVPAPAPERQQGDRPVKSGTLLGIPALVLPGPAPKAEPSAGEPDPEKDQKA